MVEAFRAALEGGASYRAAAKQFGLKREYARALANEWGLLRAPNGWTPEKIDELKALAAIRPPMSAAEIAKKLGVSRNAVIGQCGRRQIALGGLSGRPPSQVVASRMARIKKLAEQGLAQFQIAKELGVSEKAVYYARLKLGVTVVKGWRVAALSRNRTALPPPTPVEDSTIPLEQRKTLLELTPTCCRWPIGDPQSGFWTGDLFFCGAAAERGRPYCAAHFWRSIAR